MKSVSAVLVFLVLLLASVCQFELVSAVDSVVIRSDGSVEGNGLVFSGGVYVFVQDIYGQILVEKDDVTVDGSGYVLAGLKGGIFLENRSGVVVGGVTVVDAPFGITVVDGKNNQITESNCSIHLQDTFNNTIYGNERISLLFSNASENIVNGNNITSSDVYGFKLQKFSNQNIIFGNNVTENTSGIEFHGESNNNTVYENNITHNSQGMIFYSSFNNSIYDNMISFNTNSAMYLQSTGKNMFYGNDFVDNGDPIVCWYSSNIWDNGTKGNYWSDYNGTDADGDGIGDTPYYILTVDFEGESHDSDNYPLMEPNVIPEFPSWTLLSILLITFVTIATVYRRSLTDTKRKSR